MQSMDKSPCVDNQELPNENSMKNSRLSESLHSWVITHNLICLPKISEEEILKCIEKRFLCEEYYTWAGPNLLAVNPCKDVPQLFSEEVKSAFYSCYEKGGWDFPPHIFAVAVRALYRMTHRMGKTNQVMVISGDSGSGKTYSAWHILSFLADQRRAQSYSGKSEIPEIKQICCSDTILCAFGNAQTICNGNSSRFGKLLELHYSERRLVGAFVKTYLLEKTRVASLGSCERNFHIFYQLMGGLTSEELESLNLSSRTVYKVMPGSITANEKEGLKSTIAALQEFGIRCDEMRNIFIILSTIINLGNIAFHKIYESCEVDEHSTDSESCLQAAAKLLQLDASTVKRLLTVKVIKTNTGWRDRRTSIYQIPLSNVEECNTRRDSLMRFLYHQLFNWIVEYINKKLATTFTDKINTLGILDIYGFEIFEKNSLEQLCINYANERLHQYFIKNFLNYQRKILTEEGIVQEITPYQDNAGRINLLDAPLSVFGILNEECLLKRYSSDKMVCQKICTSFPNRSIIYVKKWECNAFIVRHYAGDVQYSMANMLEKNRDEIPSDFIELLSGCGNMFVHKILEGVQNADIDRKKHTVLAKFKKSLDELLSILDAADVHYIKCLKGCSKLEPAVIESSFLRKQLQSSGVLESVLLSRHGFQFMMTYPEFQVRYHLKTSKQEVNLPIIIVNKENYPPVTPPALSRRRSTSMEKSIKNSPFQEIIHCQVILKSIFSTENLGSLIQFGKTRLFLKEEALVHLESFRQYFLSRSARVIQRAWRRFYCRRENAAVVIQKRFRCWKVRREFLKVRNMTVKIQRWYRKWRQENEDSDEFESVLGTSTSSSMFCSPLPANTISSSSVNGDISCPCSPLCKCCNEEDLSCFSVDNEASSISGLRPSELSLSSSCLKTVQCPREEDPRFKRTALPIKHLRKKTIAFIFFGRGIISKRRLPQVPIRFHTRKTCLPYSHSLPFIELPQGIQDALL